MDRFLSRVIRSRRQGHLTVDLDRAHGNEPNVSCPVKLRQTILPPKAEKIVAQISNYRVSHTSRFLSISSDRTRHGRNMRAKTPVKSMHSGGSIGSGSFGARTSVPAHSGIWSLITVAFARLWPLYRVSRAVEVHRARRT